MIGANLFALTTTVAIIIGLSGASTTHVRVHLDEKEGEVGVWEQCGGKDYKGPTTCAAGSVCKWYNDWYSQCTPNNMQKAHHSQHGLHKSEENHLHKKDVPYWQQCGGDGYTGSTTCDAGSSCTKINDSYSQCTPDSPGKDEVAWWGQCGGKDYKGPTTCAAGSVCKWYNDWYSQCTPNNMQKAHHSQHGLHKSEEKHLTTSVGRCWQQCGGDGYTGSTTCGEGLECKYLNNSYWQCTPKSTEPGKVAWWGQCGGKDYNGLTICTAGSVCTYNDAWFSQCIPQCE